MKVTHRKFPTFSRLDIVVGITVGAVLGAVVFLALTAASVAFSNAVYPVRPDHECVLSSTWAVVVDDASPLCRLSGIGSEFLH
jgi:hypothetical protein